MILFGQPGIWWRTLNCEENGKSTVRKRPPRLPFFRPFGLAEKEASRQIKSGFWMSLGQGKEKEMGKKEISGSEMDCWHPRHFCHDQRGGMLPNVNSLAGGDCQLTNWSTFGGTT